MSTSTLASSEHTTPSLTAFEMLYEEPFLAIAPPLEVTAESLGYYQHDIPD